MRYLFGFLCVCALGAAALVGCSSETAPECQTAEDCDDGNGCTEEACVGGSCEHSPVADDTACGNDAGTCQQGRCQVACAEQGILDAIAAGGGPYTFDCNGPQTVVTQAEIAIHNDVILDGEGNVTVDGDNDHRVLSVPEGVSAELRGLTVTRGFIGPDGPVHRGAGIANWGRLTLVDTTVAGNSIATRVGSGTSAHGIGIWSGDGPLTLTNCSVSGNSTTATGGFGGGIYTSGPATITNSTVSDNSSHGHLQLWGPIDVDEHQGVREQRWGHLGLSDIDEQHGVGQCRRRHRRHIRDPDKQHGVGQFRRRHLQLSHYTDEQHGVRE